MGKTNSDKNKRELEEAIRNVDLYSYFAKNLDSWNKSELQKVILALQTIIDLNSVSSDQLLITFKRFGLINERLGK